MIANIAIFGAGGAIGSALVRRLTERYPDACIHAFSRNGLSFDKQNVQAHALVYDDETDLANAASLVKSNGPLDLAIVATGILHQADMCPEKSLKQLNGDAMAAIFAANSIVPALIAKHFLPLLPRDRKAVFATLSARVGSISDNGLGGWYSYRASKAALNMLIKTAAIETARRCKHAVVIGLHPGTVDSPLSKPYQQNVPPSQLFTADFATTKLLEVLLSREPADSGHCFAWDGQMILP